MEPPPPEPRPSATVLLVRDGPDGLQVFMIERHPASSFASGALVFPGGAVDPGDLEARGRARGLDGLSDADAVVRVAAVRETFEECRVLLARPERSEELVGAARADQIAGRSRAALEAGHIAIAELAAAEGLELACDLLVPFAHWITPEFMPKRFDTHFFLVPAPEGGGARHDGVESVDSVWISPAAADAEAAAGRRTIIFPTLMNLRKLGRSTCVADAVAAARASRVVTVLPRVERDAEGRRMLRIPEEAGYGAVSEPV
jgi:8-oxo-dGTP pyrophosphatase MutT (NUDIX family)